MITKANAVKMSIRKWEALARGQEPKSHNCGFCIFYHQYCDGCPLYPDVCQVDRGINLFREWLKTTNSADKINTKRGKKIAQQILQTIKERGAKWIMNQPIETG